MKMGQSFTCSEGGQQASSDSFLVEALEVERNKTGRWEVEEEINGLAGLYLEVRRSQQKGKG